MANRFAIGVLVLAALLASAAPAQDHGASDSAPQDSAAQNLEILEGVEVRHTSEVPVSEKLGIILRRALVPTARLVAPLYAYPNEIACDDVNLDRLVGHEGSAAIVVPIPASDEGGREAKGGGSGTTVALYRPTVTDAVRDARKSWCPQDDRLWYFATTYPLDVDIQAEYYLSRNVKRIDEQLRGRRPAARRGRRGARNVKRIDEQLRAYPTSKNEGRPTDTPGALDKTVETR